MLFICLPALPSFKVTFIFKAHSCDNLCEAILNLSIIELSFCVLVVLFIPLYFLYHLSESLPRAMVVFLYPFEAVSC